jgi:hypothetical protein
MAAEAIQVKVDREMAFVAELAPVGMALPAFREADVVSFAFSNNLFPDFLQKLHVLKAHIRNVPDTLLIFGIRSFEEGIVSLRESIAYGVVTDREEHYQRQD